MIAPTTKMEVMLLLLLLLLLLSIFLVIVPGYYTCGCNLISSLSWQKPPERKFWSFHVSTQFELYCDFEHCMSVGRNLVNR